MTDFTTVLTRRGPRMPRRLPRAHVVHVGVGIAVDENDALLRLPHKRYQKLKGVV